MGREISAGQYFKDAGRNGTIFIKHFMHKMSEHSYTCKTSLELFLLLADYFCFTLCGKFTYFISFVGYRTFAVTVL